MEPILIHPCCYICEYYLEDYCYKKFKYVESLNFCPYFKIKEFLRYMIEGD